MNFEDSASELTDKEQEAIIARARARAAIKRFPYTGICYSCESPLIDTNVNPTKVFCDINCRDDYEYLIKRRNLRNHES